MLGEPGLTDPIIGVMLSNENLVGLFTGYDQSMWAPIDVKMGLDLHVRLEAL